MRKTYILLYPLTFTLVHSVQENYMYMIILIYLFSRCCCKMSVWCALFCCCTLSAGVLSHVCCIFVYYRVSNLGGICVCEYGWTSKSNRTKAIFKITYNGVLFSIFFLVEKKVFILGSEHAGEKTNVVQHCEHRKKV